MSHKPNRWWDSIVARWSREQIPGSQGFVRRVEVALATPWPELVGVDLGDGELKVVRVVRRGARVARIESARKPIPGSEAKPADRREAIRRALAEIVVSKGLRGKPAAAAVFGNDVVVRRLSLPDLKRADILAALTLECRKHVNFPIEEAEIRYEIVERTEKPGGSELQLLVCVAHRRRLTEAREAMEQAGLRPVALTIGPLALRALLRASGSLAPDEVVAYLDMGAGNTQIMVLKGEEVRFSREFGVGGAALTDALRSIVVPGQGTVELSLEEAEALKRAHGIPLGPEEAGHAGRLPLAAVSVMLRPTLERLVREVWNSFDYCNEQFLGEAVNRVVLLGDGSRVRNLPEYLTGVLKIPVSRADLRSRVGAAVAGGAGGTAAEGSSELGLGLALLERGSINFLVPAGAGIPYRVAEAVPQRIAAAVAVVLLLSVSLPVHMTVLKERERIGSLRRALVELEPRAEALRRFRSAREEETRLQDLLAHLSGGQVLWSFVLRDLSHRVGADVRLTALEVSPPVASASGGATAGEPQHRAMRFTGLLRTQGRRTEDVLAELMTSLQASSVLDQVRLEGCQAVTPALSSFTLTADLVE